VRNLYLHTTFGDHGWPSTVGPFPASRPPLEKLFLLTIMARMIKSRGMNPQFASAAEILRQSLHVMENNSPINRAEGHLEQAELEDQTAESIRAALEKLEA
jgi:hypothetical protein